MNEPAKIGAEQAVSHEQRRRYSHRSFRYSQRCWRVLQRREHGTDALYIAGLTEALATLGHMVTDCSDID
ncbi:MAG: hypothetical protein MO846_08615 [Candidatus Devosia symbiotica]|nr:hypothetical protein [Candidatus Devosia symbiotica]